MQHLLTLNNKLSEINKEIYNIRYPTINGICYKLDDATNSYHIVNITESKVTIPEKINDTKISKICVLDCNNNTQITFTKQIEVDPDLNKHKHISKIIGLNPTIKLNYSVKEVEYMDARYRLHSDTKYSIVDYGYSPSVIYESIFGFVVDDISVDGFKDEKTFEITIPSSIISCKMKDPAKPCIIHNNSKLDLNPECVSNNITIINTYDFDTYIITTSVSKVIKSNIVNDIDDTDNNVDINNC